MKQVKFWGAPKFGSKGNFQHFRKQLYWYTVVLVRGTLFYYAAKKICILKNERYGLK